MTFENISSERSKLMLRCVSTARFSDGNTSMCVFQPPEMPPPCPMVRLPNRSARMKVRPRLRRRSSGHQWGEVIRSNVSAPTIPLLLASSAEAYLAMSGIVDWTAPAARVAT